MKNEKTKNIVIVVLVVLIIILIVGVTFLGVENKYLKEKYDDLNYRYMKLENISNDNIDNSVNNDTNNSDKTLESAISKDEALNIALKDLNITKNNIRDLDIELEYKIRYGKKVYEVSFDYNNFEYEYYIDAYTKEILDNFKSID